MGDKSRMAALVERVSRDHLVLKVFKMAKVLHGLYMVDHPPQTHKGVWKKLVTSQRKRAVMACFRMVPLHALPRHRVINLFLKSYKRQWLSYEEPPVVKLIEDITSYSAAPGAGEGEEEPQISCTDGLKQLITGLCRSASDQSGDDPLYIAYANIMGMSCSGEDDGDDDDEGDDGGEGASFEEQEMQKQQLLSEQARLADRGAAEMVLLNIAASNGEDTEVVRATIDLGIAILLGGNVDVQRKMLSHLKDKKEVGFFTSLAGLMQQCTVLDLDAFERYKKAQDLGVPIESVVTLQDADFTCKIFRFLQLLCEGHNLAFQDYLRTQAGNTTTVNLIICTVDYLLRLQDSMMDFYWHYSGKDNIETAGKLNFVTGIKVGKQIFCSLTEYIQGPCVGNQLALAHSRLWDAIGGFFYIFAHMQDKLSKQPEQLELMREFMKLKKEMMVMLLSMLEGNVVGGPIGKQMVETLIESSANVEMILKFFEIFLKMKDVTSSEAFLAFDINGDGVISHKEFRHAMMQQKMYTEEEIEYIMNCVDANQDGKVDFNEFTERFHNPAKEIGFNLALLLVNLHEHIPNDPRLERLIGKAQCMLDYFEPYLGRIEIMGSSGRIERVYFEVTQSNIDQWEAPQIKESKRSFLYSVINEGGDKEKLESFINFCEDTIFEMQHAQRVSGEGEGLSIRQVAAVKAILEGERVKRLTSAVSNAKRFAARNARSLVFGFFAVLRSLTPAGLVRGAWRLALAILAFAFFAVKRSFAYLGRFGLALAFAPEDTGLEVQEALQAKQPWLLTEEEQLALERLDPRELCALDEAKVDQSPSDLRRDSFEFDSPLTLAEEEELECETPTIDTSTFILSLFARNFYNFKLLALALAFFINFILLFFRVTSATDGAAPAAASADAGEGAGAAAAVAEAVAGAVEAVVNATVEAVANATEAVASAAAAAAAEAEEPEEWVTLSDSVSYLRPLLRILAALHSCFALSMLIAYNCLKVPLVVFKREKEISRMLEFDGMWISEQPGEDNLGAHWDKLVLPTPSFPDMYWDKFVKKKVLNKFQDQFDEEQITKLLGMKKSSEEAAPSPGLISRLLGGLDVQYLVWKWGVILTDNSFLYLLFYLIASLIGNFNQFFFACHLLDVAIGFKTLRTILQSVTHNGKQLVLTVLLTSIIIYLYTVLAFNFFRRFYVKEGDGGAKDLKCHDMLTCFVFHMHTGLRAGGGIGDEIESPDGDPYEVYRILFDITFFFFVIVILLAIIQGLIIDAFGELRDQLEQVKENMESNCFICGIGKEYFDKVPHGFDKHVDKEHNFANYMFFLMHLINKPDTEYTGQETYVWELYQKRCWDFFPVGDCFRKQYEDELKS